MNNRMVSYDWQDKRIRAIIIAKTYSALKYPAVINDKDKGARSNACEAGARRGGLGTARFERA